MRKEPKRRGARPEWCKACAWPHGARRVAGAALAGGRSPALPLRTAGEILAVTLARSLLTAHLQVALALVVERPLVGSLTSTVLSCPRPG